MIDRILHRAGRAAAMGLLAATAMLATSSLAHTAPFSWSVQGGLTDGRFGGDLGDLATHRAKSGAAGVGASYRVQPWLSIQPELWWIRKGGRDEFSFTATPGETFTFVNRYKLDYLELPIVARVEPVLGAVVRPHVIAGAAAAFRMEGQTEFLYPPVMPVMLRRGLQYADIFERLATSDYADSYRRFDVDVVGGGGLALGRGPVAVELEARYLYGLRDIMPPGSVFRGYNRAWVLTGGVRIR